MQSYGGGDCLLSVNGFLLSTVSYGDMGDSGFSYVLDIGSCDRDTFRGMLCRFHPCIDDLVAGEVKTIYFQSYIA
jgi:hypothetical protein